MRRRPADLGGSCGRPSRRLRNARGDTPAARWNVRTKFERSPKPTSNAMSVIERASSASRRAAWRSRERTRYWCGVTPSTLANRRRKWNAAEPGLARGALEIDRLVRVRVDPERGVDRAAAIARGRRRAARAAVPRRRRRSAPRSSSPTSSSADVAAALRGGLRELAQHHQLAAAAARRRRATTRASSPIASTSSGARWNDRHSSPHARGRGVQHVLVAGMADQERAGDQLVRLAAHAVAEAALAHVRDRVAARAARCTARSCGATRAAVVVDPRSRRSAQPSSPA